jgi:hypothetical protein
MYPLKFITTSLDEYLCILNTNLEIEARLNVNHPLPSIWSLKNDYI